MRSGAAPLLPLLRSRVQGDLLALLYLRPDREYSLTEAAARIGVSVKAVHQEASRLVDAGLLVDRRVGNVRLVRAAVDTLLTRPLTDLLAVTYGPLPVLTDALAVVPGIERAFIHGSWAARYQGELGPVPYDVDVLVIGTADADDLDAVAQQAQQRLSRPVQIRRFRPAVWRRADPGDPFLRSVREGPLVELHLGSQGSTTA
jgi:DNA-binding transcriptional ArsR family regulator